MDNTVPVYMDQGVAQGLGLSVYRNSEDSRVFVFLKKAVAQELKLQWFESPTPSPPPPPPPVVAPTWSAVAAASLSLPPPVSPQPVKEEEEEVELTPPVAGSSEEPCFCANVQVPAKKKEQFKAFDKRKFSFHVDGKYILVQLEIFEYTGDGDYDFTVLLWGTSHLTPAAEYQREVFEELRRWLRHKGIHRFWHKGLGPVPPARQEVYMWFQ